jgi:hypothetical protein
VSWSVSANADNPASPASWTTRVGESVPSDIVEWLCKSITSALPPLPCAAPAR